MSERILIDPEVDAAVGIDLQKTFMPGGGLAIPGGDEIVELARRLLLLFRLERRYNSEDVHCKGHNSWASSYLGFPPNSHALTEEEVLAWAVGTAPIAPHANFTLESLREYLRNHPEHKQMLWSDHGDPDKAETQTHPRLQVGFHFTQVKGDDPNCDSYSAFRDALGRPTGFHQILQGCGVKRLFMFGLAFDYCVGFSALDAVEFGFEVYVVEDATRSVNNPPGSHERMRKNLLAAGVRLITSDQLIAD